VSGYFRVLCGELLPRGIGFLADFCAPRDLPERVGMDGIHPGYVRFQALSSTNPNEAPNEMSLTPPPKPTIAPHQRVNMSNKLYVGNLSFDTTENELQDLFAAAGAVQEVILIQDRITGRSKGFGFVTMSNAEEAKKAISQINGKNIGGRALTVNEARPKEDRPPGGGGGGGRRDFGGPPRGRDRR